MGSGKTIRIQAAFDAAHVWSVVRLQSLSDG